MQINVIQIVIVLLVCSLAFWVFQTYVLPHVPQPFNTIIIAILAIVVILWLLSLVGLLGGGPMLTIPARR